MRELLTTSPIWSGVGGFLGRRISLLPTAWMCLIWLNMHLFPWILVLIMSLSPRDMMTRTLLYFTVSCWLDMASKTFWNVVDYFLPITRIQTVVLFRSGISWLHGVLFVDREVYDMLWGLQYCATVPMGVPISRKLMLTSNISYLTKIWSERSFFNVGRV